MIGRGVLSNPWLIRQCHDHLSGRSVTAVSLREKAEFILAFLNRVSRELPPPVALGKMKKMGAYLSKGIPGGSRLRAHIHSARSCQELLARIRDFFSN